MWVALIPAAYLLGTFPSAMLVARASGVDITASGSGNPGASNVTRTLGWRKGALGLRARRGEGGDRHARRFVGGRMGRRPTDPRVAGYALGAAAIVGHVFPVTRRFRGGKGVATGAGVMVVLHPAVVAALAVVWLSLSRVTGRAALASIACVVLFPVGLAITGAPAWEFAATVALAVLVLARHLGNMRRLFHGAEPALTRQTR